MLILSALVGVGVAYSAPSSYTTTVVSTNWTDWNYVNIWESNNNASGAQAFNGTSSVRTGVKYYKVDNQTFNKFQLWKNSSWSSDGSTGENSVKAYYMQYGDQTCSDISLWIEGRRSTTETLDGREAKFETEVSPGVFRTEYYYGTGNDLNFYGYKNGNGSWEKNCKSDFNGNGSIVWWNERQDNDGGFKIKNVPNGQKFHFELNAMDQTIKLVFDGTVEPVTNTWTYKWGGETQAFNANEARTQFTTSVTVNSAADIEIYLNGTRWGQDTTDSGTYWVTGKSDNAQNVSLKSGGRNFHFQTSEDNNDKTYQGTYTVKISLDGSSWKITFTKSGNSGNNNANDDFNIATDKVYGTEFVNDITSIINTSEAAQLPDYFIAVDGDTKVKTATLTNNYMKNQAGDFHWTKYEDPNWHRSIDVDKIVDGMTYITTENGHVAGTSLTESDKAKINRQDILYLSDTYINAGGPRYTYLKTYHNNLEDQNHKDKRDPDKRSHAVNNTETSTHDCCNFTDAYYRVYAAHNSVPSYNTNSKALKAVVTAGHSSASTYPARVAYTFTEKDNTTGMQGVMMDVIESANNAIDENEPIDYYNLQGIRVDAPKAGQIYILRQGTKAVKRAY